VGREAANPGLDTEVGNDKEPGALPRHGAKEELIEVSANEIIVKLSCFMGTIYYLLGGLIYLA